MFKVIIAGGREFNDYELLCKKCNYYFENIRHEGITIISGGARGADRLGTKYATERSYELITINADWDTHGKSAGYKRNTEMGEVADLLIAFWDNKSRGTKNMIDIMKDLGKRYRIVLY